ncbi:glutaredoxin family protein [Vibrio genomosp. F10]|uniref:NrdH-redoxin n=2 Tax=Vibrio genomosp. F10 TaxID=723171 RepID=A0A1E5BFM2_9VIBR|nr:glutaredoxin family protein [Vibrio genomosp. F10]OEE34613.1 NrdH-redoxin [Vibrio genomosp. F10 str. ZF-129]OEE96406.1 NrdH-redoxin [Vibrio genomosp. F10 str. 9ZC157]OEF05161.1 NrdH-redoxin [Vibrio genomosp. F10 str. 9ZB36]OEF07897.1 NrdH-redoxin [Vibrio genomosp. F10 str. 9ZD137]
MITLYSTEGCHLCEMALELLKAKEITQELDIVDIAFDDTLFSRYGVTIPVVKFEQSELNWPFNSQELQSWLDKNGITYHS